MNSPGGHRGAGSRPAAGGAAVITATGAAEARAADALRPCGLAAGPAGGAAAAGYGPGRDGCRAGHTRDRNWGSGNGAARPAASLDGTGRAARRPGVSGGGQECSCGSVAHRRQRGRQRHDRGCHRAAGRRRRPRPRAARADRPVRRTGRPRPMARAFAALRERGAHDPRRHGDARTGRPLTSGEQLEMVTLRRPSPPITAPLLLPARRTPGDPRRQARSGRPDCGARHHQPRAAQMGATAASPTQARAEAGGCVHVTP